MWPGRRGSTGRAVALLTLVALVAAGCGIGGGGVSESLAQLAADQERYDGQTVRTEGIVRSFDDPPHYWIEDDELNRVELVPAERVQGHLGARVEVQGSFSFRENEGRRITVDDLDVLDASPETSQVSTQAGSFTRAAPAAFAPLFAAGGVLVINVHVPYDGEIEGTDTAVPYDRIEGAAVLPTDRAARIAVYCRSGAMSSQAAATLVGLGYTDVWELEGGMAAWTASGRDLVSTDGTAPNA